MEARESVGHDIPLVIGGFDEKLLSHLKVHLPSWGRLVTRRTAELNEFSPFMDTTFYGLYKPVLDEEHDLTPVGEKVYAAYRIAQSLPEWDTMRARTILHPQLSVVAALVIGELVAFPKDERSEAQGDGDEGGVSGDNALKQSIREAVKNADRVTETAESISQTWGTQTGAHEELDAHTLKALAEEYLGSSRLHLFLNLLGKLRIESSRRQKDKVVYIPEETTDITIGNDLRNILPSELMLLEDPLTEILFHWKYSTRQLLQWHKESRKSLNKGPVIVLVDVSGSMQAALHNHTSRGDWALAVALAMTTVAQAQHREYYVSLFDMRIVKEVDSRNVLGPEEVLSLLKLRPNYGTSYDVPITRALEVIEESAFSEADVILITDGECRLRHDTKLKLLQAKANKTFKVISVMCGASNTSSLTDFSDSVLKVESLLDADTATEKLFSI